MTLVRERRQRHQQALKLSLPPPSNFLHRTSHLPSTTSPGSPAIINDLCEFEKLAILGRGNGGTVYKVRHKKNRSIYALKVLLFDENTLANRQQALQEAEILKRVDSPYIIRCLVVSEHGCAYSDKGGDMWFVMEYMEGGSLHDVLQAHNRLPEEVISGLAKRVLEGLKYLHGMKIVHRDIKPSNLLLNGNGEVKIADFGVSEMVAGMFEAYDLSTGTRAYMSPERFDPERYGGEKVDGFAGDVWSMGVVVLECFVGHFPLIGAGQKPDWATLMCAICFSQRLEMPENASPNFMSFVRRCLERDWRNRGTVTELLQHPFVNNTNNNMDNRSYIDGSSSHTRGLVDYILHS